VPESLHAAGVRCSAWFGLWATPVGGRRLGPGAGELAEKNGLGTPLRLPCRTLGTPSRGDGSGRGHIPDQPGRVVPHAAAGRGREVRGAGAGGGLVYPGVTSLKPFHRGVGLGGYGVVLAVHLRVVSQALDRLHRLPAVVVREPLPD